jgi:hypothetical protein
MSANKKLFMKQIFNQKLKLKYSDVDNNVENKILDMLQTKIENKCIIHGFVKKNSIKILDISLGELFSDYIMFNVLIECLIACPYESMILNCKVDTSTKVGLKCSIIDEDNSSPYLIFVARDHNYNNSIFSEINIGNNIEVRVIGYRYELNDPFISIIAELLEEKNKSNQSIKSNKKTFVKTTTS